MTAPADLLYYITAHGYGHGVRSCDILRALYEKQPELRMQIISDLPEDFLRNRLPSAPGLSFRRGAFDVGMVQLDSIRVDRETTLERLQALLADHPRLLEEETRAIQQAGARLVVADIPSIPLEAAHAVGIPGIAIGNFSWDWIYADFLKEDSRWQPAVDLFRKGYACAETLLRLPFSPPMQETFPRQTTLPVLARRGTTRKAEITRLTGAEAARRWVLLSFTSLNLDATALETLAAVDAEFFTVQPLAWSGFANIHAISRHDILFSDVVASVDAVVSKPGYGILSDVYVNEKPLIYADRGDFAEYPVLVDALRRHFRAVHLPSADLYAGRLAAALDEIERQPGPPEPLATGGDLIAAAHLLARL